VAEWLKAQLSKSCMGPKPIEGSNPSSSAKNIGQTMKRILVLYTKTSEGRKKLAENITSVLKEDGHVIEAVDFFELERGLAQYTGWYFSILSYLPGLWNFVYNSPLFHKLVQKVRQRFAGRYSAKLEKLLTENKYELVVASAGAATVVSYLKDKGWYQGKLAVYFSEFYFHPTWFHKHVDLYLPTIVEQKEELLKLGVPEQKIAVVGVTVPPAPSVEQGQIVSKRTELDIRPGQKVVLVVGGDRGVAIDHELIGELQPIGAKTVVVAGANKSLQQNLKKEFAYDTRIAILGFVEEMDQLYQIADVVVSIPSAMIIAEVLRYKLPIVISETFTSQGRESYSYLLDKSLVAPDFVDVRGTVADELETGNFKSDLSANPSIELVVQHGSTLKDEINRM
jgi:processive 1,2-diacylglycerol beta-glucosyltransferase